MPETERSMNKALIGVAAAAASALSAAQIISFDGEPLGQAPTGWTCGVTGTGSPRWHVAADPSTGDRRVLLQSGSGTFPWCIRQGTALADGFVETKFLPISGRGDQAGGVVWRWKDGNRYYVARANALENNVSLYYTEGGRRNTIKYVDAPVARGMWHTLRVDFAGSHIAVTLDGHRYIEHRDDHIAGPGAVGVWTKADSVTAFRDFGWGSSSR
jgi:hypothetical protein